METSTEEKFLAAVEIIKNLPKSGPIKPSNDLKLKFYSYYKQATEGPCELPKPSFWDIVNRAKWDAWSKLQNMSKEEAMKSYVEEFVAIMKETIPKDPESVNDFYNIMGPYIDLVPEEIRAKHGLVNGNSTKFLNNNTLENVDKCNGPVNGGKAIKRYEEEDLSASSEGLFGPLLVNGINNMNGNNNDSDSDEFSDTLEQVNESESDENNDLSVDVKDADAESSAISSAKGSILHVRGGSDQMIRPAGTNSPAAGPSGARGNRSARQARSADNPLHPLASNNNVGGAGGSRRSGGNVQYDVTADANEQLALAVIRLQHIMEQVVIRLDTLESLLTQRQAVAKQVSAKKSWTLGVSSRAALFFLAWPFIVQWLVFLYRRKYKRT